MKQICLMMHQQIQENQWLNKAAVVTQSLGKFTFERNSVILG